MADNYAEDVTSFYNNTAKITELRKFITRLDDISPEDYFEGTHFEVSSALGLIAQQYYYTPDKFREVVIQHLDR